MTHNRPGQRQRQKRQERTTQEKEDQILQSHATLVLVDGELDELHRRPVDLAEFATVEKVNDDRHRHCGNPEEQQRIEETHLVFALGRAQTEGEIAAKHLCQRLAGVNLHVVYVVALAAAADARKKITKHALVG